MSANLTFTIEAPTGNEMASHQLEALQSHYRQAWLRYTTEVDFLQAAVANETDEYSLKIARARVDAAVLDYRDARNALAEFLLSEDAPQSATAVAGFHSM